MNERDGVQPSPESHCGSARILLKDLWVDGGLSDVASGPDARNVPDSSHAGHAAPPHSSPSRGDVVDASILRHIEACPSCRQEADELKQLGQSLRLGLDSLCGAIAETMDQDIEGALQRIREESGAARFLRLVRRPLRLVLWISFLAFTLLASVLLASAVYEALRGL